MLIDKNRFSILWNKFIEANEPLVKKGQAIRDEVSEALASFLSLCSEGKTNVCLAEKYKPKHPKSFYGVISFGTDGSLVQLISDDIEEVKGEQEKISKMHGISHLFKANWVDQKGNVIDQPDEV